MSNRRRPCSQRGLSRWQTTTKKKKHLHTSSPSFLLESCSYRISNTLFGSWQPAVLCWLIAERSKPQEAGALSDVRSNAHTHTRPQLWTMQTKTSMTRLDPEVHQHSNDLRHTEEMDNCRQGPPINSLKSLMICCWDRMTLSFKCIKCFKCISNVVWCTEVADTYFKR